LGFLSGIRLELLRRAQGASIAPGSVIYNRGKAAQQLYVVVRGVCETMETAPLDCDRAKRTKVLLIWLLFKTKLLFFFLNSFFFFIVEFVVVFFFIISHDYHIIHYCFYCFYSCIALVRSSAVVPCIPNFSCLSDITHSNHAASRCGVC
jgi:hypothetical protein